MKKSVFIFAIILAIIIYLISFVSPAACAIEALEWNQSNAVVGDQVQINLLASGDCSGSTVNFEVKELDESPTNNDNATNINPPSIVINQNQVGTSFIPASTTWSAEWQNDTENPGENNPPEYYIVGKIGNQNWTSRGDGSLYNAYVKNLLNVIQEDENNPMNQNPGTTSLNTSIKLPATCSDSEIKKTWDSIFKESSSGINITPLNLSDYNLSESSFDICPVFSSYKIVSDYIYYLSGSTFDFFGTNVTTITGAKMNLSQEFIDLMENNDLNLLEEGGFENYLGSRLDALNITNVGNEFESVFRETSGQWEQNESDIYNDTIYSFTKIDNSSEIIFSLSGILLGQQDLGRVIYFWLGVPDINFANPGELVLQANASINQSRQKLKNIENQIKTFPVSYQQDLADAIGVANLENQINSLSIQLENSSTSKEYLGIIQSASNLRIPSKITIPITANSFKIFPDKQAVDLDILETIGAGTYENNKADEYKNAISYWDQAHIDLSVNYKELGAVYYDGESTILRVFELGANPIGFKGKYFIVLRNMENLNFGRQYGQQQSGNYQYLSFTNEPARIVFTTTANVDFSSLPVFVSPGFTELDIREPTPPEKKKISKWWLYLIILIVILIVGFIIYFFLRRWYERKYENYLFKNKNHLFNLITYINNMKNQSASDNEIVKNLKKAGWHGEQIRYGMLKYTGKNTGMPRIPLLSFKKENIPIPNPAPKPTGIPPKKIPKRYRGV